MKKSILKYIFLNNIVIIIIKYKLTLVLTNLILTILRALLNNYIFSFHLNNLINYTSFLNKPILYAI